VTPAGSPAAQALAPTVLARTTELARIPAPSGAEQDRAAVVRRWWEADGWAPVTDEAGNVWARALAGPGAAVLVCAHLDTVFGADVPHVVSENPGRLAGPSVADDSIGVAALSAVASLLGGSSSQSGAPPAGPLWLLATVGEEGMGNLAGITYALAHPPQPVAAVIAVEGNYLGRVVNTAVGSIRWRVTFEGPGGHAWERSGSPSAVHAAARAAANISGLSVPGARFSVNIGSIGGGEAINARARAAWFEVDLRAAAMPALRSLAEAARRIVADAGHGLAVRVTELGTRPAGSIADASPLAAAAAAALDRAGIGHRFDASSTDANAAHAAGVPAVALGVTYGEGEHTPAEWIKTGPVAAGLTALADTVALYRAGYRAGGGDVTEGGQAGEGLA
jgi:acetylornithine deacetylase/succinyl-diaminopimelate desuccinylase-like protein